MVVHEACVAGLPLRVTTLDNAAAEIVSFASDGVSTSVRLANAFTVASAWKDPKYFDLMANHGRNYPDGIPLIWFMRAATRGRAGKAQRVRGPSLFGKVLATGREQNLAHILVGTTEQTLAQLEAALIKRFPGVHIAQTYAPPFTSDVDGLVDTITKNVQIGSCDIVWVGLGSPKQDFVASRLAAESGRTCVAVGAAFDFYAGTVTEAPQLVQRMGMEWLFRLRQDPKRLWRRYTIGSAQFLFHSIRYHVLTKITPNKRLRPGPHVRH